MQNGNCVTPHGKQEDVLKAARPAVIQDQSKLAEQEIEWFSKRVSSVYYTYDAQFRDPNELQKWSVKEELV